MPATTLRELDDDSLGLLVKAYADELFASDTDVVRINNSNSKLCGAPLDGLCVALYGFGGCGSHGDGDWRIWRPACETFGLTTLPAYPGGPTTWRATFLRLCFELRKLRTFSYPNRFAIAGQLGYALALLHLIEEGADVNATAFHDTALIRASEYGNLAAAQVLIAAGAIIEFRDYRGFTALLQASRCGHPEIVRTLLAAGADVNARDDRGRTALIITADRSFDGPRKRNVVKALVDAGADVDGRGGWGKTALMQATAHSDVEMVRALLDAGANVNAVSDNGLTALGYAPLVQMKYVRGEWVPRDVVQAERKRQVEQMLIDAGSVPLPAPP